MLTGAVFVLYSAPSGGALSKALLVGLPLFGRRDMHLALHRLMGRSCHASVEFKEQL